MLAMISLFFCSDISPKLPLKAMANCHITSMHFHQGSAPHVDLNRVDPDNHLAPQTYKPISENMHGNSST